MGVGVAIRWISYRLFNILVTCKHAIVAGGHARRSIPHSLIMCLVFIHSRSMADSVSRWLVAEGSGTMPALVLWLITTHKQGCYVHKTGLERA